MPSPHRTTVLAGAAAALIAVAALIAGALLLADGRPPPAIGHDPAAADALVAAYHRSRTAAYRLDSVFQRDTRSGRQFSTTTKVVQRDDARLTFTDTSVDGILDGRRVGCSRSAESGWQCKRGAPIDLAAEADAETNVLRDLVAGRAGPRLYSVTRSGSCFRLRLTRTIPAPPYGREGVMCFDDRSGALSRLEVRRSEAVDVTVSTRTTLDPDDGEFVLPAPLAE